MEGMGWLYPLVGLVCITVCPHCVGSFTILVGSGSTSHFKSSSAYECVIYAFKMIKVYTFIGGSRIF